MYELHDMVRGLNASSREAVDLQIVALRKKITEKLEVNFRCFDHVEAGGAFRRDL
jgi:hypothetical protein